MRKMIYQTIMFMFLAVLMISCRPNKPAYDVYYKIQIIPQHSSDSITIILQDSLKLIREKLESIKAIDVSANIINDSIVIKAKLINNPIELEHYLMGVVDSRLVM
jgi:hypothetical protein